MLRQSGQFSAPFQPSLTGRKVHRVPKTMMKARSIRFLVRPVSCPW